MNNTPDVIVLCGGAGLRLRSVIGDAQKAMARIGGHPFLELLLQKLDRHTFRRVILAIGYKGEAIRGFFGNRFNSVTLLYSPELKPLGTGGAVRNAAELVTSDAVLVINGDTYTDADLVQFVADFKQAKADASVLLVPADGRDDCGTVTVGDDRAVLRFSEKNWLEGSRYINAGVYIFSRRILYDIPEAVQISLEDELFPHWLGDGIRVTGFIHQGRCVDIGTPDRYHSAQALLKEASLGKN